MLSPVSCLLSPAGMITVGGDWEPDFIMANFTGLFLSGEILCGWSAYAVSQFGMGWYVSVLLLDTPPS